MFFDRASDGPSPHRPLMGLIILTLLVGASGTLFTEPAIPTWYDALVKPSFNPPNWLFAPVWTTLYIAMAVAAWRVWKITGLKSPEMTVWFVQLALNAIWTPLFFGAHLLLDPATIPDGSPHMAEAQMSAAHDGFTSETRRLWTEDGRLAVENHQSIVVIR